MAKKNSHIYNFAHEYILIKGLSIKDVELKSKNVSKNPKFLHQNCGCPLLKNSPYPAKCPHWTKPHHLSADVFYG